MGEPRFRKLSNGDLIVPRRGQPPTAPEGYYQSSGDSYLFHPIMFDCEHRVDIKVNKPNCSKTFIRPMCMVDKEPVTKRKCKECQDASKTKR